jgi:hypothetical protein
MEKIYHNEEMYWQQKGSERWILEGDANAHYFLSCANSRRRKTRICSLETDHGMIVDQKEISNHIVDYYKLLFGSSLHRGVHLMPEFWPREEKLGMCEQKGLREPFSEKEVEMAISGMKSESAPGPSGYSVIFFKKMWKAVKKEFLLMV